MTLVSCTARGEAVLDPAAAGIGAVEPVFVGTTRAVDPADNTPYSGLRSPNLRYVRMDISVPPDRKPGEIDWPVRNRKADPTNQFVTVDQAAYATQNGFRADLKRALTARPKNNREVVVFVHGFNNTFAEGTYRLAQLGHDLGLNDVLVHYSWPSKANPLGYVYDRDSALFARDGLETLLNDVAESGAERILLIAHSMGAFVLMEALRQDAIADNRKVMDRIAGVVLMSPDIDLDVFRSQARRIGPLPQPFVIFTSHKDKALFLSARLTGRNQSRLGNVDSAKELADLNVTVLDTTAYSVGAGHFNTGDSPALLALLGKVADVDRAFAKDKSAQTGLLPGAILTFRNATEIILSPVVAISNITP